MNYSATTKTYSQFHSESWQSESKCPFARLARAISRSKLKERSSCTANSVSRVMSWMRNFVAKPHPLLGRNGAVCPFVPRALKENALKVESIDVRDLSKTEFDALVKSFLPIFESMEPSTGKSRLNKSLVIVIDGLEEGEQGQYIEDAHNRLKLHFVERGLMLGEFHKFHGAHGVHNPDFRPLKSPVPMLVIRHMVKEDHMFLDRDCYESGLRTKFVESYNRTMAHI